ncbi:MAG: hypothetical protein KJN92_11390 [Gemmatimonadetes bacterium]|nr:hypothetical protein [Gemmatimonadota bacterium]
MPTAIDVDPEGRMGIYDYQLGRLSLFAPNGRFLRSVSVHSHAKDLLLQGDQVWFSDMPARENLVWRQSLQDGEVEAFLPVTRSDLRFQPRGMVSLLSRGADCAVLVAHMRPGKWFCVGGEEPVLRGSFSSDQDEYWVVEETAVTPGFPFGIGLIGDDRVAIIYNLKEPTPPHDAAGVFLDVFSTSGQFIGSLQMPERWVHGFTTNPKDGTIFVGSDEPYPTVTKYRVRLTLCSDRGCQTE